MVRFKQNGFNLENLNNTGSGTAQGIDFFFRNKNGHIKNLDYWVTYSYIDSERLFEDFPTEAQPNFIANHNAAFVSRYWLGAWRSQIGLSYRYGTGRPFTNANTDEFLGDRTPDFHQVDLSWAYLIDQQKILFVGINNVLNFQNVFGYQYANEPDLNGIFNRQAIVPQNNQFFVVGFLWTISADKTKNQLDNL